jgi:hypothetical protein
MSKTANKVCKLWSELSNIATWANISFVFNIRQSLKILSSAVRLDGITPKTIFLIKWPYFSDGRRSRG